MIQTWSDPIRRLTVFLCVYIIYAMTQQQFTVIQQQDSSGLTDGNTTTTAKHRRKTGSLCSKDVCCAVLCGIYRSRLPDGVLL